MSDIVIAARDLRKVYRLYAKPHYRFLDMFGLLGVKPGAYSEHAAVDGVNLEIRRGEKVAFVGRNGAGKSTLLKLITNVVQPTSGSLTVAGTAHALLQIGTGFHPDFTGRENIRAYLAQLGLSSREVERLSAGIIDFAEIEEYIDQPVKTYSSGMSVRLMFATSTAITPDLLILDEVLGVGDAYFARKSYDRIRELCDREGTTLLLVSHDVYSASKICNRMIWLDRGRVLADQPSSETLKLYEDSVRIQEESRLRKKSLAAIRRSLDEAGRGDLDVLTVEVAFSDPRPTAPVYISRIAIMEHGTPVAELAPASASRTADAQVITDGTSWGDGTEWEGRSARALQPFGSVFGRVAAAFNLPGLDAARQRGLQVEIDMTSETPVPVIVSSRVGAEEISSHAALATADWQRLQLPVVTDGPPGAPVVRDTVGTGAVALLAARVVDATGRETVRLTHGEPATLEFDYHVRDTRVNGPLDVIVSVLRGGVETACRFFTRDLVFDGTTNPFGTLRLSLPSVVLGTGTYSVLIMFARHGYAEEEGHTFYSIHPGVYVCVRDVLEFEVSGGNLAATGTAVLLDADWTTVPSSVPSRTNSPA